MPGALADGIVAPTKLAAMPPFGRVRPFALSPVGTRVAYRADADTDERYELYSVPSDGSAPPVKLSFASRADTDVPDFGFSPTPRASCSSRTRCATSRTICIPCPPTAARRRAD